MTSKDPIWVLPVAPPLERTWRDLDEIAKASRALVSNAKYMKIDGAPVMVVPFDDFWLLKFRLGLMDTVEAKNE